MKLNPYLAFNGQCEAAFKFYEKCLGGKIVMSMTYGNSPIADQSAPDWRDKILHSTLALGDSLVGADAPPDRYQKPQGISVMLNVENAAEADRIFRALSEKGTVPMPIQETFWACVSACSSTNSGRPG